MLTLLAAGTRTAVNKNATIEELEECFSDFISKGTIALLVALFPALFYFFVEVEHNAVECRAEWISTNIAEFSLAALVPCEIEVHIGLLEGKLYLLLGGGI